MRNLKGRTWNDSICSRSNYSVLLTISFAHAQDATSKVQVFGGYSLLHADTGGLDSSILDFNLRQFPTRLTCGQSSMAGMPRRSTTSAPGWESPPILAVTSARLLRCGAPARFPDSLTAWYLILVGPVISYRVPKKLTPFAHALFGWNRTSLSASTFIGTSTPLASVSTHYDDFTLALGGGVDYKLSRRFALRLAQLDRYHTSVNLNSFYGTAFNTTLFQGLATRERNLRFSAGIVINF